MKIKFIVKVFVPPLVVVERHENGYFLDKKVDTSIPIIVLGQENGYFFIKYFFSFTVMLCPAPQN
ncbi:hypothetical protein DN403_26225 [Bacillus sp. AY2-1]|nr:hypothetical protein DN403_26225 [Bacillus sp. AY2-1]